MICTCLIVIFLLYRIAGIYLMHDILTCELTLLGVFFSFYRKTFLKYMTIVHSSSGFIPILFKTTGKFS